MNFKKYKELDNALRIENLPGWLERTRNDMGSQIRVGRLFANHKDHFLEMWGRQEFCYSGEYRHWVWSRPFKGFVFYVWSGNQGTTIEVVCEDIPLDEVAPVAFEFVEHLCEELKERYGN